MRNVIVPQIDLDNLEEARIKLWKYIGQQKEQNEEFLSLICLDITRPMFQLTHRKYPKQNRIAQWILNLKKLGLDWYW